MIYNADTPKRIRGQIYFISITIVIAYGLAKFFLPNEDLILICRSLQAGVAAAVVYVYWPDFLAALKSQDPEKGDFLIVGITIGFMALFCQATYSIVFRMAGAPEWLMNTDIMPFWIALSIMGGILHLIAPGAVDGLVPRRNRIGLGAGLGLGVTAIVGVLYSRPDLAPAIEWLKPWITDVIMPGTTAYT